MECQVEELPVFAALSHCPMQRVPGEDLRDQLCGIRAPIISYPHIPNINRTKPGKSGAAHERTESAFVQAMKRAKWPTHYLAVESLSGKSRALFLTGYDSFAE